jgi:hypothetical protein
MNVYRRLSRWYRDKPRHAKACDSRRSLTRRADAHDLALYDIAILTDAAGWPSCGFALSTDHYRRVPALGRGWLIALHVSAFGGKADMTLCGNLLSRSLLGVKRTRFLRCKCLLMTQSRHLASAARAVLSECCAYATIRFGVMRKQLRRGETLQSGLSFIKQCDR